MGDAVTDIVERLRYHQNTNGFDDESSKLVDEAIAEIERLRVKVEELICDGPPEF